MAVEDSVPRHVAEHAAETQMTDQHRLFVQGRGNPETVGWPVRSSAGAAPDPERLAQAARLLGRPVFFLDADGYEREIIGAAVSGVDDIAFVESRAKARSDGYVDISIRVHLVGRTGEHRSADIESYNPFFGCDVRFFEWIGDAALLVYREKHSTYACRLGDLWPPRFVKIEDAWVISGAVLGYASDKVPVVRRLSVPALDPLEPISAAEATKSGLVPEPPP